MEEEHQIWMKAMEDKVPTFYEGIAEFLGALMFFPWIQHLAFSACLLQMSCVAVT